MTTPETSVIQQNASLPDIDLHKGAVILADKPAGWTSFDVIRHLKRHFKGVKLGHAGTLDPLATGLLIICTGQFTKQISTFQQMEKTYEGRMRLGGETPTYDAESSVSQTYPVEHLNKKMLEEGVQSFIGEIEQVPPPYSAVKVQGKRAYDLARKGKATNLQPRRITIYDFVLTDVQFPEAAFEIRCSTGTYIRSIAHDLGRMLNTGAYLTALRRTAIGAYKVEDALTPSGIVERIQEQTN